MNIRSTLRSVQAGVTAALRDPRSLVWMLPSFERASIFAEHYHEGRDVPLRPEPEGNRLWEYFDAHTTGRGVTKWSHYFEPYDRHFSKLVGASPRILEIGVFRGGSLEMWTDYFGSGTHISGIDVDPDCRAYERDGVAIAIGDQADPGFWAEYLATSGEFDVVVDDGGHLPHQQIETLEAVLGAIRPGGVYLCEDIHGVEKQFLAYAFGLVTRLNEMARPTADGGFERSAFQRVVHSIHFYPYVVVIEKHSIDQGPFRSLKRGSLWDHEPED